LSATSDKPIAKATTPRPPAKDTREAAASLRDAVGRYPKYVSFLRDRVGVGFRGRILELGAGPAWFTAELSKLPKVVEVIATDFTPGPLPEEAAVVFKALRAQQAKIARRQVSAQRLEFPDRHFDFVVCNAVLHEAMNLLQLLREVRRVLKPGGQLIAVREPVKPLVKWRAGRGSIASKESRRMKAPIYSRADYEHVFERAGFSLEVSRVSLASGLRYYFDTMVNGLTHARCVLVATRKEQSARNRPKKLTP
jgi:ubiquinone/menaquinone biosynthesis C-methylase UbiE